MVALSGKRRCSCASVVTSGGGIRLDLELRLAHINIRVNAIPAWNVPRGVCVRPIAIFFFFSSANEREARLATNVAELRFICLSTRLAVRCTVRNTSEKEN